MLSLLRLERKQKNCSNRFRIGIFFFLSCSFGIETINTFVHSRSSLKNHTRFQTKMGEVYTRFQTKTAQKPYHWEWHIPKIYILYKEVPPPPPSMLLTTLNSIMLLLLRMFYDDDDDNDSINMIIILAPCCARSLCFFFSGVFMNQYSDHSWQCTK